MAQQYYNVCVDVQCFDSRVIGTCKEPKIGKQLIISTFSSTQQHTDLGIVTAIEKSGLEDYDLYVYANKKSYYLQAIIH